MFSEIKPQFLFRCIDCKMVLSLDIEEPEDLEKIRDNKMELECVCGSVCHVLRD